MRPAVLMPTESARYQAVREVFHEALARDPDARGTYLDDACAGDPGLRAQVESLLASDSTAGTFLSDPAVTANAALSMSAAAVDPEDDPLVAQRVGGYLVTGLIATGGMGRVYRAEQEHPARAVALKLLRGVGTPEALRRFDYEAHILARLRHPAIAQVYEAGLHSAPGGPVPFFAMELVPGALPITDYARASGRTARRWLPLFLDVCDAVHHGHQKGVVHRDLKPANILVDADGRVKVIDFGVARLTDADVALTLMPTVPGGLFGTLAYMSPEQCAGDPREVDTRSDVYALGAVLYELLTGSTPHDVARRSVPDAVRAIQELPPRRFPPDPRLDEDLRTITLKALEKARERRYQSAADLAADLRRWLAHQPILARPPTTLYQIRMFARRNRTLVGAGAAIALVTLGALAAVSGLYLRAEASRRDAERSGALAREEATRATAVLEFLVEMLSSADPVRTKGDTITVREAFDAAAPLLETRLRDQPAVRAVLESTVGTIYRSMRLLPQAAQHLRRAHQLAIDTHGAASIQAADAATQLGSVLWKVTGKPEESRRLLDEAVEAMKNTPEPQHARLARALLARGSMDLAFMRVPESVASLNDAVEHARAAKPPDPRTLAACLEAWGSALELSNRLEEARAAEEESIEILRKTLGDDWPELASKMATLAGVCISLGDFDRAAALLDDAHARMVKVYGAEHRNTIAVFINRGDARARAGRHEEALSIYREGLETMEQAGGRPNYDASIVRIKIGGESEALGDLEGALLAYQDAHRVALETVGPEHQLSAVAAGARGAVLAKQGKCDEALALLEPACEQMERAPIALQAEHRFIRLQSARASCLEAAGRPGDAAAALERTWAKTESWHGWKPADRTAFLERLATLHDRLGQPDRAAEWRARVTK